MSEESNIQWTDNTWSPWRGCTKVSPGCANCYAETLSHRNPAVLGQWGKGKPRVLNKNWQKPRQWDQQAGILPPILDSDPDKVIEWNPVRVFPSLCDWLDDEVPIEWLAEFLVLIHETPNITWQLLSKRPECFDRVEFLYRHMSDIYLNGTGTDGGYSAEGKKFFSWLAGWVTGKRPPANVHFGVSVENQEWADKRIPVLLKIPAAVRWLSCEPLIGPVNLQMALEEFQPLNPDISRKKPPVDWVVVGGESGKGARPCDVNWIRSIRDQCKQSGVPVFIKQLGAHPILQKWPVQPRDFSNFGRVQDIELNHKKGGDMAEWPEDLRIRQEIE